MKFSGKIGFWIKDVEIKPGVFKPQIIEKNYTGDVLRNIRRFQSVENQQNENLAVNNKLSIISDLYLQQNWGSIKYVSWNGVNWQVSSVDIGSFPRIVLELGGVYNGKTPSS
ncbi:MAG: hypothetical protein MR518_06585 [Mollicutes bacterium]|nr:hypothetical protein [Mollicutes bacterium]